MSGRKLSGVGKRKKLNGLHVNTNEPCFEITWEIKRVESCALKEITRFKSDQQSSPIYVRSMKKEESWSLKELTLFKSGQKPSQIYVCSMKKEESCSLKGFIHPWAGDSFIHGRTIHPPMDESFIHGSIIRLVASRLRPVADQSCDQSCDQSFVRQSAPKDEWSHSILLKKKI